MNQKSTFRNVLCFNLSLRGIITFGFLLALSAILLTPRVNAKVLNPGVKGLIIKEVAGAGNHDHGIADPADATLASLQIGDGNSPTGGDPVSPAFDPSVTAYTGTFPFETNNYIVVTCTNTAATVTINGNQATPFQLNGVNLLSGPVGGTGNGLTTIVVTSADQSVTKTYTVTTTKAPASAKLSSIVLVLTGQGPCRNCPIPPPPPQLDQTFSANQFSYTATVPYSYSSIPVSVLPTEPSLTPFAADVVKINGQVVSFSPLSHYNYTTVPLNFGQNVIPITVISPDGNTTNTYTLTIIRQYDPSDVTLASLQVPDANTPSGTDPISPSFDPSATAYTTAYSYSTQPGFYSFTTTNPAATVTINGSPATPVQQNGSNLYSGIKPGAKVITIVVRSADKSSSNTYIITYNRAPALAKLQSLALTQVCRYCNNTIPLDQTFSPDVFKYTGTATYAQTVAYVDVVPTEQIPTPDAVTINGIAVGGITSNQLAVPLNVGQNIITVSVTSPDGSTVNTYTITVTRMKPPSNDQLSGLTVLSGNQAIYEPLSSEQPKLTLNPDFNPETLNYSLTADASVTQVSVFPSPSDYNNATMIVNGSTLGNINPTKPGSALPNNLSYPNLNPINLGPGTTVISIKVIAADSVTTQTYTITINRPLPPPTRQAIHLYFTNTTASSSNVSWTNGNGTARAVFVAQTNSSIPPALSNFTTYTANAKFGAGTQAGNSGWYCVYNGSGSGLNIANLLTGTTYRVSVIEYNGSAGNEVYLSTSGSSPANVTTLQPAPTTQSIHLNFTATTATTTTVNWTSGSGTSRAVFISNTGYGTPNTTDNTTYIAKSNYGNGSQIGTTGWYCIYNGNGSSASITGLLTNATYRVCVVEYDGTPGNEKYLSTNGSSPANVTTLLAAPTQQAIHVQFSNITGSSFTANWTNGNGLNRAVFLAKTNYGIPSTIDGTHYAANNTFGKGTQCTAGWYCVYNGSASTINVSGLAQGTTYRMIVIEYNGPAGSERYLTTSGSSPANITAIQTAPTTQALHVLFTNTTRTATTASWTNGNGQLRAVFMAKTANGVPATADQTTYTANSVFGFGTQSTAGWYCVYNGAGNTVNITGLVGGTTYRLMVVEYDGTPGNQLYLHTSGGSPANVNTTGAVNSMTAVINPELSVNQDVREKATVVANNILSPNGDGVNDTWLVKNIELYDNNVVTVYNSAGNIVFSKKNYLNDWDGTYHGSVLNEGSYYYTIDLGNAATLKGFITVVRDR